MTDFPNQPSREHLHLVPPAAPPRFLSESDCHEIAGRIARFSRGGGASKIHIRSRWTGHVRWARNRIITAGEDRDNNIMVTRGIRGASGGENGLRLNDVSDAALVAAVRRAERLMEFSDETFDADLATRPGSPFRPLDAPVTVPQLFFESTFQQTTAQRSAVARRMMESATAAGMLSAGDLAVSATSFALITSWGYTRYMQYTWAKVSTTVRDPKGVSSGWAGVDWPDWSRIHCDTLAATALDKCLRSRNPVAVEPGRYTTILEPQAVGDLLSLWAGQSYRLYSETGEEDVWHKSGKYEPPDGVGKTLGLSRIGERVIDERITFRVDPMDPELGFPPYASQDFKFNPQLVYRPITWIERGVLRQMHVDHTYAVTLLGKNESNDASGAFRMDVDGPTTSVADMIATTKRGLLVTRFSNLDGPLDRRSMICRGYTRDGLWLIENGKISKPVKNMAFTESILFVLNNVEQLGVPQRIFHPAEEWRMEYLFNPQPIIVPALKIKDFSFTALTDAI